MNVTISVQELGQILAFSIVHRVNRTEESLREHFGVIAALKQVCKDDATWQAVCRVSEEVVREKPEMKDWLND